MPASSTRPDPRRYRLCDFVLESEWPLPELVEAPDAINADVVVRRGETPRELPQARQKGVCFATQPGTFLCWLDGVARFCVREGREVIVETIPGTSVETVRSLLFSSPFAALALQRGLLPLHASAVVTPKGARVFSGGAGMGKSLLAAEFQQRGYGVLADDITVVRVSGQGDPCVLPVSPCLRLWPAGLAVPETNTARTLRPGSDKRLLAGVSSGGDAAVGEEVPLAGIVCLERSDKAPGKAGCARLAGMESVAALLDVVYRPAFVQGLGLQPTVFRQVSALAAGTPTLRYVAAKRASLRDSADRLLEELGQ